MQKANVFGRAWIYDDDPCDIEVWEHELQPMDGKRSGAEWCREHLQECPGEDLRKLLNVPKEGNFQVIFKGIMTGETSGYYEPEWDEWFDLEESRYDVIPAEYLDGVLKWIEP